VILEQDNQGEAFYVKVLKAALSEGTLRLERLGAGGLRQCAGRCFLAGGGSAKPLEAGRQGKPALIFGDGGQTRDFCPVANVVAANIAAATRIGEGVAGAIFNVGSGHSISVLELAESIVGQYPAMGKMEYRKARNAEIRHSRANISKARDFLRYQSRVSSEKALEELIKTAGGGGV